MSSNDLNQNHIKQGVRSRASAAVDASFLEKATAVCRERGLTPVEILHAFPGESIVDIAKRVDSGVNAIGLVMAIYDEAVAIGKTRDVAKTLLIRTIHQQFPSGWNSSGTVRPAVRMSSWSYELKRYCKDQAAGRYAERIVRELTRDNPPPEGWLPTETNDPRINSLFDRHWTDDRRRT
jgi:hypothetical protein